MSEAQEDLGVKPAVNTHGVEIDFGKHKGTAVTRLPVSYLRWMANEEKMAERWKEIARAELARRGTTMPMLEISGHAIDNASLRVRKIWHETRGEQEGIHAWLHRVANAALTMGKKDEKHPDRIRWIGIIFVFAHGEEFPILKTVMREKRNKDLD